MIIVNSNRKRTFLKIIAFVLVFSSFLVLPTSFAFASSSNDAIDDCCGLAFRCENGVLHQFFVADEFEHPFKGQHFDATQRGPTCCHLMRLTWRFAFLAHFVNAQRFCERVHYVGDQICTTCGAVWQRGVVYQTGLNCQHFSEQYFFERVAWR